MVVIVEFFVDLWYNINIMPSNPEIPPETEYLIDDVEQLVNERAVEYLDGTPFRIHVRGFQPDLTMGSTPYGIRLLDRDYMEEAGKAHRELLSIAFSFQFPLNPESSNPINTCVNWSDNTSCRLAIINNLPLIIVERNHNDLSTLLSSRQLTHNEMAALLNSIGLPESIWGVDTAELLAELNNASSLRMTRKVETLVDPYTTLEFVHDAHIAHDIDGEKQLIQELCLNIDHLDQSRPDTGKNELQLVPHPRYRSALRFSRSKDEDQWKFAGAYHGKLSTGELLHEKVQLEPQLGVPRGKVLDKALSVLNQRPY